MTDLVGTCPHGFWPRWIAEGDPVGEPWSGTEWAWYCVRSSRPPIEIGERFYVVARGMLRGYAPVVAVRGLSFDPQHGAHGGVGVYVDNPRTWRNGELVDGADEWAICRNGDAVAITIAEPIRGFQGLRHRWWSRVIEKPFPDWRTAESWVAA